ncbi:lectin like domain-containing protein [Fusibacter sp. 3D3]|uniref:lectin like domain-containing protein n=1 Tax=Fusibacter sp. 3D3 TaxID=1048380 RepID=UPI0008536519|nr:C1 family peptidase [Fusibacter sp. 3D3]GAU77168.1 cell surface protein [Fusibacter sp. 3D3]
MNFSKKIMSLVLFSSLIFTQFPTYAQTETVKINLPTFPITINALEIDNSRLEYPLIVYNNITYFPMTYEFSKGLGLKLNYTMAEGLTIAYAAANSNAFTVNYLDSAPVSRDTAAQLPSYPIKVNNVIIKNDAEVYPLLNYKGISYFPLTWRFVVEDFGWQYAFDTRKGLNIKVSNVSSTSKQPATFTDTLKSDETIESSPLIVTSDVVLNALDYSVKLPKKFNIYDSLGSDVKSLFVRDQGNSSTCWAFAANTLFELSLATQHHVYLDFSEDHLVLNAPIKVDYDSGGYIGVASAYYNNWIGPIVDPTDTFGDGKVNNNLKPEYVISDFIEIENNLNELKYAIYKYGAAQSSIGYNDEKIYYNQKTYGFYNYNPDSDPTHDIVIVGWDDSYSKDNFNFKPKTDGAFIAQNSWGDNWGEQGIFYVSYEDVHINEKATLITSISKRKENQKQYYYDNTGVTHFEGYSDTYQVTGLNVFKSSLAQKNVSEYLTSIGFYTNSKDVKFMISYANKAVPESTYLELTEIASGTAALPGYHTLTLDKPLKLSPNQAFSIAVTYQNDETIFLVPLESPYPDIEYTITGNLNESYISPDPDYYGFTDIGEERENSNVGIRIITEFK